MANEMIRIAGCSGALLTGGDGRRFGGGKMQAAFRGKPLASYGLAFLEAHFAQVLVCGRYSAGGCYPCLRDRFAGGGPLAGIETALRAARFPWVFMLAGDMPFPQARVLERIWRQAAQGGVSAVVPRWARGSEPLFAMYHRDCLLPVQTLLRTGERSIRRLFGLVETAFLDLGDDDELAPLLPHCFYNVNFPEDLVFPKE